MRTVIKVPEVSGGECMQGEIGITSRLVGGNLEDSDMGIGFWDVASYDCICREKRDYIRAGCGRLENCWSYDGARRGVSPIYSTLTYLTKPPRLSPISQHIQTVQIIYYPLPGTIPHGCGLLQTQSILLLRPLFGPVRSA